MAGALCDERPCSLFRRVVEERMGTVPKCAATNLNVLPLSCGGAAVGAYVAGTTAPSGRSLQLLPAPSWGRLPACLCVERRASGEMYEERAASGLSVRKAAGRLAGAPVVRAVSSFKRAGWQSAYARRGLAHSSGGWARCRAERVATIVWSELQ